MTDRINTNRPSSDPRPAGAGRSTNQPTDSPGVDQAAAEFASLLGAEPHTENEPTSRRDSSEGTDSTQENEQPQTDHGRVESKKKRDGEGKGDGEEGGEGDAAKADVFALGDVILQGFSRKDAVSAAGVEGAHMMPDVQLDNIVQQVADRILISPPGGQQEVRIMLKDNILPGTEIRISQQGGQLQIQMVTDSARSHELLTQHQAALQQRLTERLGEHDVVVQIEMESQGQPDQQGRSRQRRDIYEETKEGNA